MSLQNEDIIQGPPGNAISLSVSRNGHIYAGWSSGALLLLRPGQKAFECYVQRVIAPFICAWGVRMERPRFGFARPLGLDAWGLSNRGVFVADAYYNRIFESPTILSMS